MVHILEGRCAPLPPQPHARWSHIDATNGSHVTCYCDSGFSFQSGGDVKNVTCDGVDWSPLDDICIGKITVYKYKFRTDSDSCISKILYIFIHIFSKLNFLQQICVQRWTMITQV